MMAQTVEGEVSRQTRDVNMNSTILVTANIMQASKKKLLLDHLIVSEGMTLG
jgi:hypothetical protein